MGSGLIELTEAELRLVAGGAIQQSPLLVGLLQTIGQFATFAQSGGSLIGTGIDTSNQSSTASITHVATSTASGTSTVTGS
jgi:hypothetical protein